MAKTGQTDRYVNRTLAQVSMSAANVLTFQQVRFAAGLFEGLALKLVRVEWNISAALLRELGAATDSINFGITTRDDLVSIDPTNLSVLASYNVVGMGAGAEPMIMPIIMDFSNLPEGGLLIPANPMYLGINSAGVAAALGPIYVTMFYNWIRLTDKESLELLQTLIPGTV